MWVDTKDTEGILDFINHPDTNKVAVSIMQDLKDSIRPTFILDRGLYDAPTGEALSPKTPDIIKPFSQDLPKNRLGLVEWAFAEDHPLTSRVFVNLIWQEIFGVGLVPSSGDFGMQGKLPTHPELLDWLAVEFRESGWDIKKLIKLIVSSSTYSQSSAVSKEMLAIDPDNTYLSRFPRLRLHAELIRDMVLASSGLLVEDLGGPSVKPYQPEGLWEASSSGRGELNIYRQDKGDKLYRRGIYTFIKLTLPPPSLLIFDGSNRDICQVNRNRTNTPLQALALLNDPLVLEASRVLAESLVDQMKDEKAAIGEAFVRILGRLPKEEEDQLLMDFYAEELLRFEKNPEIASGSLDIGESPASKKEAVQTAALMQVIVALYNLEEAITKT